MIFTVNLVNFMNSSWQSGLMNQQLFYYDFKHWRHSWMSDDLRLKNAKLFQLIMFSVHHKTEINIDLEKVWHEIWS